MFYKRYFNLLFICTVLFTLISFTSVSAYPEKNITNIIPWSAGGGTDAAARGVMHYAEKHLNVTVVNENITGAQSGIGILRLMISRPDGYTIGLLTWDSVITVPYYELVPGYDLDKLDFICTLTEHSTALVVRNDSPWDNLEEFISDAKNRPGQISISNVGTGGVWHLPALDLADKLGIEVKHIPYPEGAGPQREALLSGETDSASISIAGVLPSLEAGEVRILAVMSEERDELLPNVPTFKELGYDVVWGSFRVIAVPKEVPEEIKDTLEGAFRAVFDDEEFVDWAAKTGLGAVWRNREDTNKYLRNIQKTAFELIDDLIEKGLL